MFCAHVIESPIRHKISKIKINSEHMADDHAGTNNSKYPKIGASKESQNIEEMQNEKK